MTRLINFTGTIVIAFTLLLCPFAVLGQFKELRFEQITSENGLPQNTIHGIAKDKFGFMWFGTWSGLCRFDGYKFKVYRYNQKDSTSIINNRIHNLVVDKQGNLWVETFDANIFCKYNYEKDSFERVNRLSVEPWLLQALSHRYHYTHVKFSYQGTEWATDGRINGLMQTDLKSGISKQLLPNSLNRWSLNDSYVTDIFLDDSQIFWVGTYNSGLNKANLKAKPFHLNYHDSSHMNSLVDNNVRAICEDINGNRWIGTRDRGISVMMGDKSFRQFEAVAGNPASLTNNQIKAIFSDSHGNVWVGTKKGLDKFNIRSKQFTHTQIKELQNISVYGATEDNAGNIWFATWRGIYKYDAGSEQIVNFDPRTTLGSKHAVVILQAHNGQFWVGTEGGGASLLKINSSGQPETVAYFHHEDRNSNSLSDDRVYSIFEDSEHKIWIGTGNGLDRYDANKKNFTHFSVSPNGLTNATIAGITEDNKGYVWVSHKRGISRINKQNFTIRNYSVQDGLQSNEFADGAVFKSKRSGMLFFGGNRGYNSFFPDSIRDDKTTAPIVFTDIQVLNRTVMTGEVVNGRVLLTKPLYLTNNITLNHKDRSIAIEFATLYYANPRGCKYAYMLEGFDKDWIYTDATGRMATYSNLSRGQYVFKVRAANSDGVWSKEIKTLSIKVLPPWWASTWAYIIYGVLFIIALRVFYYYFMRFIRLKGKLAYETLLHQKELELRQSKIEFFTNVSHEIKTPLSLILGPIEQLSEMAGDNPKITGHLMTMTANGNRLLKLINQLLDIRRLESGHDVLKIETGEVVEFIRNIMQSFTRLADSGRIAFDLVTEYENLYASFDHDKLEKILINLLSNAFKFTDSGGSIKVNLGSEFKDGHILVLEVTDNGRGIPKKDFERIFKPFQQVDPLHSDGTGIGLSYAKSLVESHGGEISVVSNTEDVQNSARFTRFTVKIPVEVQSSNTGIKTTAINIAQPDFNNYDLEPLTKVVNETDCVKIDGRAPLILLAEDNYELRKYLKSCLVENYDIIEAENGIQGVALATERLPDIIISDVMMPEMDGLEFCKNIKTAFLTSHIPFILLTARAPIEYQIEGIETGADDYMTKPFNITLLKLKIRNQLLHQQKMQERYRAKIDVEPLSNFSNEPEDKLLTDIITYVEANIADTNLNVDHICDKVAMSRSQLYRKLKAVTGYSVSEIIKNVRLKKSKELLANGKFNVSEISYMIGFTDTDYFRKCFKAEFGITPSEYAKSTAC